MKVSAGFVRFTAGWYIVLVTKRTTVALLGGHYVYNCVQSAMISIDPKPDKSSEEQRYGFDTLAYQGRMTQ